MDPAPGSEPGSVRSVPVATEQTLTDAGLRRGSVLMPGELLGRYVVQHVLGSGGMGTVYAAQDPQLGRRVAVKLLHGNAAGIDDSQSRSKKLLAEAQAMASFSDPHVITVHDVGTHEGRVFIAMDLVRGETLAAWMKGKPWREVLDKFQEAGRGLAAVHAAGFVHRDFKPSNVMVHGDGRVVVMDFGLAQRTRTDQERPLDPSADSDASTRDDDISRRGSVQGTPAYMPPEQHLGFDVDASADQFSFCVALFEGLYGTRPFRARTVTELLMRISSGEVVEIAGSAVPVPVRKTLLRGLAEQPQNRWPSLQRLLRQLELAPGRSRRIQLGVASTVLGAGALAALFATAKDERSCEDAAQDASAGWTTVKRGAIETALTASGRAFGRDTAKRVDGELDRYVTGLVDAQRSACAQAIAPALLDRRTGCLRQRRGAFEATVDVLGRPPADDADDRANEALDVVAALPDVAVCLEAEHLARGVAAPADPMRAAQVAQVRDAISRVTALEQAGDVAAALEQAEAAEQLAEDCDFEPVHAEALCALGSAQEGAAQYDASAATFERAFHTAQAGRHDEAAARAAVELMYIVGYRLRRGDDAEPWSRHATAVLEGVDAEADARQDLRGQLLSNRAALEYSAGELSAAATDFEKLVDLRTEALGSAHPTTAAAHSNLGLVLSKLGRQDESLQHHEVARQVWERALGPEHPRVAVSVHNAAVVLERLERFDDAAAQYQHAIDIRRASLGAAHPGVAHSSNNLGHVRMAQGRHQEALELHQAALSIWREVYKDDHPRIAGALEGIAIALNALERPDEARMFARRALDMLDRTGDGSQLSYVLAVETLAKIEHRRGDVAATRAAITRGLQSAARVWPDGGERYDETVDGFEALRPTHDSAVAQP